MQSDQPNTTDWHPVQVYEHPERAAASVLAECLGISEEHARNAFVALFRAGFYVGPMEPTNSMLLAYMSALPARPKKVETVCSAIAKARRRWKAMAMAGNKVAMSERGGTVDAAGLNPVAEVHAGSSPAARTNGGVRV